MRKKQHKKISKWWWISVPLIVLSGGMVWLVCSADEPPVKEMEEARMVLAEAERLDAEVYSRRLYRGTKMLYDSAMVSWKRENDRLFVLRKYEPIVELAGKIKKQGSLAIIKAQEARKNSKADLRSEIELLRQEMGSFEKLFAALPLSRSVKDKHSKGKLLLNAAEIAFEKEEYSDGQTKSRLASDLIRDSYRDARKMLAEYFSRLPQWKQELSDAVEYSRKKRTCVIVVEKIPGRCDLYCDGVRKYTFKVEFGKNWIGDKRCEGDYATPEGVYKVTKKLQGGATKYYKALLMNYPNSDDRKRFAKLKKEGQIARHAGIGNLLEVHGSGGRGANWTNGCVALENKDMDKLYRNVDNGTMIVIIGASVPLEEVLKNQVSNE